MCQTGQYYIVRSCLKTKPETPDFLFHGWFTMPPVLTCALLCPPTILPDFVSIVVRIWAVPLAHMLTYGPHLVVLFREIEETFGGGTNRRKWGLEGVLLKVIPDPGVPCSGHPGCSELSSTTLPHNPHPKKKKKLKPMTSWGKWVFLPMNSGCCYQGDAALGLTSCWKWLVGGIQKHWEKWARESLEYRKQSLPHGWFWGGSWRADIVGIQTVKGRVMRFQVG